MSTVPVPPREVDYVPVVTPVVPPVVPPVEPPSGRAATGVEKVVAAEEEHPTESHALANEEPDPELIGAAQLNHGEPEVKDLGWNEDPANVPKPLVGGLPNEELWTLVRRFNKVSLGLSHSGLFRCLCFSSKCTMSKSFPKHLSEVLISISQMKRSSHPTNCVQTSNVYT